MTKKRVLLNNIKDMTTVSHDHPERSKQHKFMVVHKNATSLAPWGETGYTYCGHTTYVSLREPKPTDVKCKVCYR